MAVDNNGLLIRQPDTNGWATNGVEKLHELHPDATPTEQEIEEVLEYLALNHPGLLWDLIRGIPTEELIQEAL